jgi:hypothetical protein
VVTKNHLLEQTTRHGEVQRPWPPDVEEDDKVRTWGGLQEARTQVESSVFQVLPFYHPISACATLQQHPLHVGVLAS